MWVSEKTYRDLKVLEKSSIKSYVSMHKCSAAKYVKSKSVEAESNGRVCLLFGRVSAQNEAATLCTWDMSVLSDSFRVRKRERFSGMLFCTSENKQNRNGENEKIRRRKSLKRPVLT